MGPKGPTASPTVADGLLVLGRQQLRNRLAHFLDLEAIQLHSTRVRGSMPEFYRAAELQ